MKIEVLNAIVDGKGKGEVLTIDDKSAEHLIAIGYAKKVAETPKVEDKPKPEPKKPTAKRNTRKKSE